MNLRFDLDQVLEVTQRRVDPCEGGQRALLATRRAGAGYGSSTSSPPGKLTSAMPQGIRLVS